MNKTLDDLRSNFDIALSKLSDNITSIKTDLAAVSSATSDIKSELNSLRSEHVKLESNVAALDDKYNNLLRDVTSLQKSLQYTSDEQDKLSIKVNSMVYSGLFNSSEVLNDTVITLEAKIDTLEQQARQCNIEICNIPERGSENLITLMQNICMKSNFFILFIAYHMHRNRITGRKILL